MKKLSVFIILLLTIIVMPFVVNADDEVTTSEENNKVNVYLFRGEGCPHCQEAEEWFATLDNSKFTIVDYEVWHNEDNSKLMDKVANARGEEVSGVPYIIIGNKSWNGFASSYESEILAEIESEYAKEVSARYDIMKLIDTKIKKEDTTGQDVLSLIIILVVLGGVIFGIYKARTITK